MSLKRNIIKALSDGKTKTVSELVVQLGAKRTTVRGRLSELKKDGVVTRTAYSKASAKFKLVKK